MKKQTNKASQMPTKKTIDVHSGKISDRIGFCFSKSSIVATTLMLAIMFSAACSSNVEQPHPNIQVGNKAVVLHVGDFSKSTDQIVYFDSNAAINLLYSLANSNGGTIKFIGVYENSTRQNVLSMQVDRLDTVSTESEKNIYKIGRIRAKNKRKLLAFDSKIQEQISLYTIATAKPHNEPFTDLTNALSLASTTLNQPSFSNGYNKYLLLCSDCINDPKGERHAKLIPINLPHTTVLVVRPALSQEALNQLFPLSSVYIFTDVNDAISMIK